MTVWSENLPNNSSSLARPILQNLRFYQRLIPISL